MKNLLASTLLILGFFVSMAALSACDVTPTSPPPAIAPVDVPAVIVVHVEGGEYAYKYSLKTFPATLDRPEATCLWVMPMDPWRECGGEGWTNFPPRYQPCEGVTFSYQKDADGKVSICADAPPCDLSWGQIQSMYLYAAGTDSVPSD